MRLYLMRHADAGESPRGGSDGDRSLSGQGRREARDAARALAALVKKVDAVCTSSLVRAVQTGEIVAQGLSFDGTVDTLIEIASGCSPEVLLHALPAGRDEVVVVGHEPSIGAVARWLLGRPAPAFAKAAMLALEWTPPVRPAKFLWFLPPGGLPQTSLP